jgi:hypothetical protein
MMCSLNRRSLADSKKTVLHFTTMMTVHLTSNFKILECIAKLLFKGRKQSSKPKTHIGSS